MSNREDAIRFLTASELRQQRWNERADDDELQSANLNARVAIAYALLDVADAIREQMPLIAKAVRHLS